MRVCELPPQPGDCGARFIRWFYNKITNRCSWFYFQGCRGNQNNFKSKKECESQCIPDRQYDNKAHNRKPYVLAQTSPMVMSRPVFMSRKEDRTSNQIIRSSYSLRAKKVTEHDKEIRRKRRLEKRRQKRLRKLRRRRKRKGLKGKKRRREGNLTGRKKRNKNKKERRNRRKNKKNRKRRRRKNKRNRYDSTTLNPNVNSDSKANSRGRDVSDDLSIVSIIDKTTDKLKSNIEKIKAADLDLKSNKKKEWKAK